MTRFLILACSQRKRPDASLLPAIERHDGPAFRVLQRYRHLTEDKGLIVYILSAEYGLIPASKQIPTYDRRMDSKRADQLREDVAKKVRRAMLRGKPSEILVCAGKTYLRALAGLAENGCPLSFVTGGQGKKLASLKTWLYEGCPI